MIYTSYFSMVKHLKENNITPVSISGWPPKWYEGIKYKKLAPTWDILDEYKNHGQNQEKYIERYNNEILKSLNAYQTLKEIAALTGNVKNIALLCFEKPEDFCHRHLVAKWLNENGFKCEEWKKET